MALFSGNAIGIDMGSCSTRIFLDGAGVTLKEATTVLALREDAASVLAVGDEAQRMLDRAGDDVSLMYPVLDGAVADCDMAALLMLALAEKAAGRRRPFEKAQLFLTAPQGLTRVERAALEQTARIAGAKKAAFALTPLAAALGAGMNPDENKGTMVVSLGGGLTEIAVLSMNAVVAARSMRSGAMSMDEAIVRYVRRTKQLIIGERIAEKLKRDIGSAALPEGEDAPDVLPDAAAAPKEDEETALLRGRDARTLKPKTVSVCTRDIAVALRENVRVIVDAMRDALSRTPPALVGDIRERGVLLSGGGALLAGLPELLATMTGVPMIVSEHPEEDAVLGLGLLAQNERLCKAAAENGSVAM